MNPSIAPLASGLALFAAASLIGVPALRKLIEVREAQRELREGSPGFLRTIRGWSLIAVWLIGTWFLGSFVGDWGASGDLAGALERAGARLYHVIQIVVIIMESDQ